MIKSSFRSAHYMLLVAMLLCSFNVQAQDPVDSMLQIINQGNMDEQTVNTLARLGSTFRFRDSDSSYYYLSKALTMAEKIQYKEGIAFVKGKIGAYYADNSRYDEGASIADESIAMYLELMRTSPADKQKDLKYKLGNAYNVGAHNRISQGNLPEGLRYSYLALKVREEIDDKKGIADTEFNIGSLLTQQRNYTQALPHFERSLQLAKELGRQDDEASVYGAIGWYYAEQKLNDKALIYFKNCERLAIEIKDDLSLTDAWINMASLYELEGRLDSALTLNLIALEKYEQFGLKEQLPLVHNSIASVYIKQRNLKEAMSYAQHALDLSQESGSFSALHLSHKNMAAIDSLNGNFKSAYAHYVKSISFRDSLNNQENERKSTEQRMMYDFEKKEAALQAEQEKKDALAEKEIQKQKIVRNSFVGGFGVMVLFAGIFFYQRNKIKKGKKLSDELLLNILPEEVAEELKVRGEAEARHIDEVTVLFTDFKGFTALSEKLTPQELVKDIHECFSAFDRIMEKHGIEKIKTIGDSYMAAGGVPATNLTHASDVVNAAFEIRDFIEMGKQAKINSGLPFFEIRIGIHTGPVVAGIVGVKKFAYDIWGDTVNTASRMESNGEAGKINISGATYDLIKGKYECQPRGKIQAKGKGEIDMYFVIKPL